MPNQLKFHRSCQQLGKAEFTEVFLDELQQQESLLNLERYCQHGGFPDFETTSFEISRVDDYRDGTVVHLKCTFEESVPTSCGGISFPHPTFAEFTVALSPGDERGVVEYLSVYDDPTL